MKRKSILKCLITFSCVAMAALVAYGFKERGLFALHAGECEHDGNHYEAVAATSSTAGSKEFWACCRCEEQFVGTAPTGTWADKGAFTGTLEPTHVAYIPSFTEEAQAIMTKIDALDVDTMDQYSYYDVLAIEKDISNASQEAKALITNMDDLEAFKTAYNNKYAVLYDMVSHSISSKFYVNLTQSHGVFGVGFDETYGNYFSVTTDGTSADKGDKPATNKVTVAMYESGWEVLTAEKSAQAGKRTYPTTAEAIAYQSVFKTTFSDCDKVTIPLYNPSSSSVNVYVDVNYGSDVKVGTLTPNAWTVVELTKEQIINTSWIVFDFGAQVPKGTTVKVGAFIGFRVDAAAAFVKEIAALNVDTMNEYSHYKIRDLQARLDALKPEVKARVTNINVFEAYKTAYNSKYSMIYDMVSHTINEKFYINVNRITGAFGTGVDETYGNYVSITTTGHGGNAAHSINMAFKKCSYELYGPTGANNPSEITEALTGCDKGSILVYNPLSTDFTMKLELNYTSDVAVGTAVAKSWTRIEFDVKYLVKSSWIVFDFGSADPAVGTQVKLGAIVGLKAAA